MRKRSRRAAGAGIQKGPRPRPRSASVAGSWVVFAPQPTARPHCARKPKARLTAMGTAEAEPTWAASSCALTTAPFADRARVAVAASSQTTRRLQGRPSTAKGRCSCTSTLDGCGSGMTVMNVEYVMNVMFTSVAAGHAAADAAGP
jgi:hypothetical protein